MHYLVVDSRKRYACEEEFQLRSTAPPVAYGPYRFKPKKLTVTWGRFGGEKWRMLKITVEGPRIHNDGTLSKLEFLDMEFEPVTAPRWVFNVANSTSPPYPM